MGSPLRAFDGPISFRTCRGIHPAVSLGGPARDSGPPSGKRIALVLAAALLSCSRPSPPRAIQTPAASTSPRVIPTPDASARAAPAAPTPPAPSRRPATLIPRFELALSLPWGTAGLTDPAAPAPGRHGIRRRRPPTLIAQLDGTLWLQTDLFAAVLVRHGNARRLPFTGAGLEWYLGSAYLTDGVLILGRGSSAPTLVRLDSAGHLLERQTLAESDAGPPLNAYALLQDAATGAVYLWSAYEHQLRRINLRGLRFEPPIAVSAPPASGSWWIHRGAVEWVTVDDTATPIDAVIHSAAPGGTAASSLSIDLSHTEGPYDSAGPYGGRDLHNELHLPRGRFSDGAMLFANRALVWVGADGAAALAVPFETVVRAGDGVAIAVSDPTNLMMATRVERWVAGQRVAEVRPEERSARATRVLSADTSGFDLYVEMPYACAPGSGGLPNRVDTYTWSSARPVRSENVSCSEAARDALDDQAGYAEPQHAVPAPDGSVLVPGADREGVFIVRVRTDPVP